MPGELCRPVSGSRKWSERIPIALRWSQPRHHRGGMNAPEFGAEVNRDRGEQCFARVVAIRACARAIADASGRFVTIDGVAARANDDGIH